MVMHMYAYGLGREVSEVPEVDIVKSSGVTVAICNMGFCPWVESDENDTNLEDAIEEHKKWHEEGMQP